MKKLTIMLLLVVLSSGMVFANGQQAESGASGGDENLIAYANKSQTYYFFVICQEGVKKAAEARGYSFEASNADSDSAKQTNQFQNFISKNPKAIISDPIDSEGLIDSIDKAVANGIPVAIVDTPTTGGDVAVTVAFDNYLAGEMAAEIIVEKLVEKYGEPKGKVFNAYGAMSSWAWRLRREGFEDVMAKYPNIEYLAVPGEGDLVKTSNALSNTLAKHPDIDAVHAPSDNPAMGLAEVLKQKDMYKKVGEEGHVIFVTIDGEPIAVEEIKRGYYDACVVQDAVSYGGIAVELLDEYTFQGKDVPLGTYENDDYYWGEAEIVDSPSGPYVVVPPYRMDSSNVEDPRHWGTIAQEEWGFKY
jgi:ABC-type sugar transport system substrate-binding protein